MQSGSQRSRGVLRGPVSELVFYGQQRERSDRKWLKLEKNGMEQSEGMRKDQVKNWKNRWVFQ
ncbi:hypothetical protein Pan153_22190 [Gimesia panareensis]|uniref:Uncharacterized protein n=1 Tax=Gimesia panareensis TaxID=2527978 RepID=A0A518FMH4_9PLAN|nr:hypothetical protein Pan153_22190 [Gimesia panareensis]